MATRVRSHVIPVSKKYTVQSTTFWDKIRRFFAVDPERSTGVPLNPHFRNPPPGALDPNGYDDPTTAPAADIADNLYWKRDVRRSYPRRSLVSQGDVVGLLSVGSAADPSQKVLVGEEGSKQLVTLRQEGEEKGLASYFAQQQSTRSVLNKDGMPPLPPSLGSAQRGRNIQLSAEQSYQDQYPCRSFS